MSDLRPEDQGKECECCDRPALERGFFSGLSLCNYCATESPARNQRLAAAKRERLAAKQAEKREFRVGDTVRVISVPRRNWAMDIGHVFTIAKLHNNNAHDSADAVSHYIPIGHLELVTAAPSEPSKVEQPEKLLPSAQEWADKQPDPEQAAAKLRENGWTVPKWDRDEHDGKVNWPSLDERIAAAKQELSRPVKHSRFDGRPCDVWPMGGEDEP
jgi:hypothetical protein